MSDPTPADSGTAAERVTARAGTSDRRQRPRDWRWWVGGVGKVLISVGLLMFGFVAYQLWGTGIETARAQSALERDFEELLAATTTSTTDAPAGSVPEDSVPDASVPRDSVPDEPDDGPPAPVVPTIEEGDPVARIEMPAIGVDKIVVSGVSTADLKRGPGHFAETPLPGQLGNSAIAGHRTTYGQPFFDVDQLAIGDEVVTTTTAGRFVYRVTGIEIVSPSDYHVVATTDPGVATLTLTSCHPKWTARERIVVFAELDEAASSAAPSAPVTDDATIDDDPPTTDAPPDSAPIDTAPIDSAPPDTIPGPDDDDTATTVPDPADQRIADAFSSGWFSDPGANAQVGLWGLVLAGVGLGAWAISRRFGRNWVGALVGVVPFVVCLYFFFQNVNRLLPPNL